MSSTQMFFGWPMIVLAIALFGVAFVRQRSWLGFAGLACALPFLWYAGGAPRGEFYSPAVALLLAAAAWFLRRGRKPLAALCFAPYALTVGSLAVYVTTQ